MAKKITKPDASRTTRPGASRELRSAALHVMVKPSIKAKAVAAAAADRRSLASWLEIAVEAAADHALAHHEPPQRAGGPIKPGSR